MKTTRAGGMGEATWSRRDFVKVSLAAGGGLLVSVYGCGSGEAGESLASQLVPNAFVRIDASGNVTVFAKHLEMGQGTYTGLATLVAEELDADWSRVKVEGAPADAARYANLAFGVQGTGGSSAIANSYEQHRKAGAVARALLLSAAAGEWNVPVDELTTEPGVVVHAGSGRRADYGSLVGLAAGLPVPDDAPLKDPATFRYIGRERTTPRVDVREKSTGRAVFTQDIRLPGMLTALVAHPPRFGARVRSFDAGPASAVPGVVDVVQVPNGVAVLAEHFWAARAGREALSVEWDESQAFTLGSDEIMARFRELAGQPGVEIRNDGDAEGALAGASRVIEATYEFPYLAHACMEPMNCVARVTAEGCEVWNGEQFQTPDQMAIGQLLGIPPERVKINMLYAGGSFGRRAAKTADYELEAVSIAQLSGGRPVKLVWTREDDTRAGLYRPAFLHRIRGGLDAAGNPVAWWHRVVGQSVLAGSIMAPADGKDPSSFEGAADHPYEVLNVHLDVHTPELGVPVQWWRSVGHTHTAFAVEVFLDELARAAGRDPVEYRRALLASDPRRLAVLNLAAERAGWGTPLPAGRARGVAVHKSFGTWVAEVAEVSLEGGQPRVHRVVCAVDCGVVVNPDVVRMQMESGIAYGLSAALYGAIHLERGRVVESNFDRYRVLRMNEMPAIEVHLTPSSEPPTGVGEPGTPPIAPAVANALSVLSGRPVRRLPLV